MTTARRDMWIKFCGIRRPEDFEAAVELEVDAVGIVAVQGTPRCVTVEQAEVLGNIPRKSSLLVLVTENAGREFMLEMMSAVKPDMLQFHGVESSECAESFELPYLRAVRSLSEQNRELLRTHKNAWGWLLDLRDGAFSGATELSKMQRRIIIAGGLDSENVGARLIQAMPFGVDISRGIEAAPGIKDQNRMKSFVNAIRSASF